jgi:hypothetical protein
MGAQLRKVSLTVLNKLASSSDMAEKRGRAQDIVRAKPERIEIIEK